MRFEIEDTPLPGVLVLNRKKFVDSRGYLDRLFSHTEFKEFGLDVGVLDINVVCINRSGTLKGLHFQKAPFMETKIVTCLTGAIFDVAVDLRPESPTRGKWFGIELTDRSLKSLVIPEGCAHGVQSLASGVLVHYAHSAPFAPSHEDGIHPMDPTISVQWPKEPTVLSERDASLPQYEVSEQSAHEVS